MNHSGFHGMPSGLNVAVAQLVLLRISETSKNHDRRGQLHSMAVQELTGLFVGGTRSTPFQPKPSFDQKGFRRGLKH